MERFEAVVERTGVNVREHTAVTGLTSLPDGGFLVTTSRGEEQASAVLLAIGRRGTPRKLDVPGATEDKVAYLLQDAHLYTDQDLLVVGGGDSAVEAACALSESEGNRVWLAHRGPRLNRPRKANQDRLRDAVRRGRVELLLSTSVARIGPDRVVLDQEGEQLVLPNDHVFVHINIFFQIHVLYIL